MIHMTCPRVVHLEIQISPSKRKYQNYGFRSKKTDSNVDGLFGLILGNYY